MLPVAPVGAAGIAEDPEHVGEGAAIGGFGDEEALPTQEDHEGDADADRGDAVADDKADVLLDVGDASQGQDGSQIDAPIKPIEKSSRGFRTPVFDLGEDGKQSLQLLKEMRLNRIRIFELGFKRVHRTEEFRFHLESQ